MVGTEASKKSGERLRVVPLTLAQGKEFVGQEHRHHPPQLTHRFTLGCLRGDELCGVCVVGKPVARNTDQYNVAEVSRLATDGTFNACSFLYGAAARACKAMGYKSIQTFILEEESGTTLKAAGWEFVSKSPGGDWYTTRPGVMRTPSGPKQKWQKILRPDTDTN